MFIWRQVPFYLWNNYFSLFLLLSPSIPYDRILNWHLIIEEYIIGCFNVVDTLCSSIIEADVVAAEFVLLELSFPLFM
jgi:hypothetical protein